MEKRVDTAIGKKTLWSVVVWELAFSCAIHHGIVFFFSSLQPFAPILGSIHKLTPVSDSQTWHPY